MFSKTLKIFVRGQDSSALKSVELSNWTGLAFLGKRSQVNEAKQIEQLADTSIYMLLSTPDDEEGGLTKIYVGETENFSKRIASHLSGKKSWWTRFVAFVSKDKNLTKAHVRNLEKKLHTLAVSELGTLKVMNESTPSGSKIPESDEAAMQEYLHNVIFVLETLSLSYFPSYESKEQPKQQGRNDNSTNRMRFYLKVPHTEEKAFMEVGNDSFILKSGSAVRLTPRKSFKENSPGYYDLWQQILESGSVQKNTEAGIGITTQDFQFRSPSAAGAIVKGGPTNGRKGWKRCSDDKALGECTDGDEVSSRPKAA